MADKKLSALQGLFDRFFSGFMVPLVRGGKVEIGAPIAPGVISYFEEAVPSNGADAAELLAARQAIAADVLAEAVPAAPSSDDIRVAAAVHNILYRTHPDLERLGAGRARRRAAEWARRFLEEAREPEGRNELVERHSIVWPLFRTSRVDTVLYNWSYRYRFYGREPPSRFLYWPTVRRIRQEHAETPFGELRFDEEGLAVLSFLMRRSALTSLLTPARALPPFIWDHDMVVALRDHAVCRAVTYAHVEQGLARTGGPLGFAFDQAASAGGLVAEDLRFLVCFYYNLLLTLAVGDPHGLAKQIESAGRQTANRTLFALQLAMLQRVDPGWAPALPLAESERAAVVVALAGAVGTDGETLGRADALVAELLAAGRQGLPMAAVAG
ncbi:MAG: hypothetical protein HYY06_31125 [Deltaproteobacteria bacterium]|nr:hypothetical protein [Deltaproteobacteria bacterium]